MYILRPDIEQSLVESNFKDNELCEKLTTLFDTNLQAWKRLVLLIKIVYRLYWIYDGKLI